MEVRFHESHYLTSFLVVVHRGHNSLKLSLLEFYPLQHFSLVTFLLTQHGFYLFVLSLADYRSNQFSFWH